MERLDLTDAQADALDTLIESHDAERRKLKKAQKKAKKRLRSVIANSSDEAELKTAADEFRAATEALDKQKFELIDDAAEFLSVEQQAKLVLAMPEFHRKVRKAMKKAKKKKKKRKNRRGNRRRR